MGLRCEVSGSGLGLTIAKTIVQGVGATMTLVSPATGREKGFEVRVQLFARRKEFQIREAARETDVAASARSLIHDLT